MASRKKNHTKPSVADGGAAEWPRPQGEWDNGPANEAQEISLAQARTPERVADCLRQAGLMCDEAERWLNGPPVRTRSRCPACEPSPADGRSEGVAKSALRDAIVALAEVWLGMPAPAALALVRRLVGEAASQPVQQSDGE